MITVRGIANDRAPLVEIRALAQNFSNVMDDFAEDALEVLTDIPRKYIPARHRTAALQKRAETATGRLWSGWGIRRRVHAYPTYFIGKYEYPAQPPGSVTSDNIAEIQKMGGVYKLTVGTNVPYANYVNEGRPRWHNGRPVYDFTEAANEEVSEKLDELFESYTNEAVGTKRVAALRQGIRSRRQAKNIAGRFTKV